MHTQASFCCLYMMVYLQWLIFHPIVLFILNIFFFFFEEILCAGTAWGVSDSIWCTAERPSLWAVQPCLTRKREGRACVLACVCLCRACVCVSMEGRHCSLTSPFSPASRCSQTRLCYSEASTGDRPSAKHGAPPAGLLERGAGRSTHTHTYGKLFDMLNSSKLKGN